MIRPIGSRGCCAATARPTRRPPDADPFDPAVWGLATPSLQHLPALLAVYEREAAEAAADPSLLPEFKGAAPEHGHCRP